MEHKSTICLLEGDQLKCWVQKLTVIRSAIPLEDLRLLFEFYNLTAGEIARVKEEDWDVSYAGLYGLEEEILSARTRLKTVASELILPDGKDEQISAADLLKKNAQRYAPIQKYLDGLEDGFNLQEMDFLPTQEPQEYYWIDLTRVTQTQYERYTSELHHVYNVAELFGPVLPFDLEDPEVVSMFGTGKFEALADFSYGC